MKLSFLNFTNGYNSILSILKKKYKYLIGDNKEDTISSKLTKIQDIDISIDTNHSTRSFLIQLYSHQIIKAKERLNIYHFLNQLVDYNEIIKDTKRLAFVKEFLQVKFKFLILYILRLFPIATYLKTNLELVLTLFLKNNNIYLILQKLILYSLMCSAKEAVHK